MKKIYLLATLFISSVSFSQSVYPGNGKADFGGPVGLGSLMISDNGTDITFMFTKGTGGFNDALVLYIDSKTGGFSSTSTFKDNSDPIHRAISGLNLDTTQRALLNFPSDFAPEYALAFDAGFAGLFQLMDTANHTYIKSANLSPTGMPSAPVFTFSINKADIGLADGNTFNFYGSYISETGYRAAEAVGDSMSGFSQGWNPYTVTTYDTYTSSSLPVKLTDFRVAKERSSVAINWAVAQETNIEAYQIQRSDNGVNFTTIQTVAAHNQATQQRYTATDASPLKGVNYYRLSIKDNGKEELSKILTVTMGESAANMLIAYMPGSNRLNVTLVGTDAGNYTLNLINSMGQFVQSVRINHDGSETAKAITLQNGLLKGVYRVVLVNDKSRIAKSFMVQ